MLTVKRSLTMRMKAAARQMCEGHGMKHGARSRRADRRHGFVTQPREDAHRIQVRVLALARAHANRRIAFQQLTAVEAFLERVSEIDDLKVFVEIDELLAARMREDGIDVRRTAA